MTRTGLPVSCVMPMNIGETVQAIASLRSPVARSCHIGNNTANVWGWLALAGNARLLQYDHTLYGVDENCIPWALLGDGGRLDASYAPDGQLLPDQQNVHVNDLMADGARRPTTLLNYGIFARHEGEDLMLHHLRIANELSASTNGSIPSWDSQELFLQRSLLADIIRFFARTDDLSKLFDRWVRTTRKGRVAMRRLRSLSVSADRVTAVDDEGTLVFEGTVEQLIEQMTGSLAALRERLLRADPLPPLSYPWLTLSFAYLFTSAQEYAIDPAQRTFWHAGGSVSQYYVNEARLQDSFTTLMGQLAAGGFLPEDARLLMIPTFCCQLVATSERSLACLEELIQIWRAYLRRHHALVAPFLAALAETSDPFDVAAAHDRAIPEDDAKSLREAMERFNEADRIQLPVAHVVGQRHPNYNKYGVSQRNLKDCRFLIPAGFAAMTWAEAELLVKTLAHLTLDRRG